jgi:hypothetical protein
MLRNDVGVVGEGHSSTFQSHKFSIFFILASLVITGCGLDSTVFYSPPTFINGGNTIILTHNPANTDASFLGYEVYYRVYAADINGNSTNADADLATITSTQDTSLYTPTSAFQKLNTGLGFVRIAALSTGGTSVLGVLPLFKYISFSANVFTIQPIGTANWYYYSDSVGTQTIIVRNDLNHDSFNFYYGNNDIDYYDKTPTIGPSGNICVVFFAVAYGFDFTASTPTIYSLPVGAKLSYTLPSSF